jgi:bifunctional N-acetylglucosamine-1-phosphate-uridyltransferase/glucosamine-1-phosphate-acetyltransferase GlmU-like protein
VGHLAQTVMDALDGEAGVVYAYQKEQKGTGHAALCGLDALASIGATGPCIISMGDKIIAPKVISDLIERAKSARAVGACSRKWLTLTVGGSQWQRASPMALWSLPMQP